MPVVSCYNLESRVVLEKSISKQKLVRPATVVTQADEGPQKSETNKQTNKNNHMWALKIAANKSNPPGHVVRTDPHQKAGNTPSRRISMRHCYSY